MLSDTLVAAEDVAAPVPYTLTKLRDDAVGSYYKDLATPALVRLFTVKNTVNSTTQKYLLGFSQMVDVTIDGQAAQRKVTVNLTVSGSSAMTPAQLQESIYNLLTVIAEGDGPVDLVPKSVLLHVLEGAY